MARRVVNRFGEMEVFVRAVELGGFSAAARALRMTPSAVSKLVGRLEARLGARLVNRSTRRVQLTPEGAGFYERSARILGDLDAAEREAAVAITPRGRLRVNSNVPFGLHCLLPLVPGFLAAFPHVSLDVVLTDAVVDLFEARADVAIRLGPLADSRLVARKLGESRMVVVASRAYLERHGRPRTPAELARHNCLGFCFPRRTDGWRFVDRAGKPVTVVPRGNTLASDGEAVRRLALAGLGIARLARFHVRADLEAGALVPLLERYDAGETEPAYAVFLGQGGRIPARIRAFLDHLLANVRLA